MKVLTPVLVLLSLCPRAVAGPRTADPRFVENSKAAGLNFVHQHFGQGEKYMPENMGPGVALLDFDGDGHLDIFFPQGAPLDSPPQGDTPQSKAPAIGQTSYVLYRNRGDGTFEDVSAKAGLGRGGYGMGVSFGDMDRDGDLDLFVANFGPDLLFRNLGDGTFEDVTVSSGIGGSSKNEASLWSTSSGFFDADGDGDLDLYVTRYVDFSVGTHKWCGNAKKKLRAYCHPDVYGAAPDVLYLGNGKGQFTVAGAGSGIVPTRDGKGLGLILADLDGDGQQDVYVANDSTMNTLYWGLGKGRFEEGALLAGVGFDRSGKAEAGMGVVAGDLDGDGRIDLFLTHLDQETNTLYRNQGGRLFEDTTQASGLAAPSLPWVGFGTVLLDHDQDGDLDIFVTNGHIIDNIELFDPSRSHRQPSQLFDNLGGGRFTELKSALGLPGPLVGRGAVAGDLDRDGDLDLVLTQNGGPALLLENRVGKPGKSLGIRLRGGQSNPQGFGAILELMTGQRRQIRTMLSASGYLSQGPAEVYFGIPAKVEKLVLRVTWPAGGGQLVEDLQPGFLHTIREGEPNIESRPFLHR
jgi:hypothetical protein